MVQKVNKIDRGLSSAIGRNVKLQIEYENYIFIKNRQFLRNLKEGEKLLKTDPARMGYL